MVFKRITIIDVSEIIRRWQDEQNITQISDVLGYDRKTVRKYLSSARDRLPNIRYEKTESKNPDTVEKE